MPYWGIWYVSELFLNCFISFFRFALFRLSAVWIPTYPSIGPIPVLWHGMATSCSAWLTRWRYCSPRRRVFSAFAACSAVCCGESPNGSKLWILPSMDEMAGVRKKYRYRQLPLLNVRLFRRRYTSLFFDLPDLPSSIFPRFEGRGEQNEWTIMNERQKRNNDENWM